MTSPPQNKIIFLGYLSAMKSEWLRGKIIKRSTTNRGDSTKNKHTICATQLNLQKIKIEGKSPCRPSKPKDSVS